jgi:hypothetical protein
MLPMIAIPLALPQDKEQELGQEFELDIRISSVSVPTMVYNTQNQITCTCATCTACNTCTCNTCHIVGTRCIHG